MLVVVVVVVTVEAAVVVRCIKNVCNSPVVIFFKMNAVVVVQRCFKINPVAIVVVAAALVVFVVRCFKMNAVGLIYDRKPSSFFSLALSSELWLAEKKITKYFSMNEKIPKLLLFTWSIEMI